MIENLLDENVVKLIVLGIYSAVGVFFVLFSFFAIYHIVRFNRPGDKWTWPIIIFYLAGSATIVILTLFALNIF